jgi:hypothetical protein
MPRFTCLILTVLALAGCPDRSAAQAGPAPLYALPADGTWVAYDWTFTGPDGHRQVGTLRISSVGQVDIKGVKHRWVEIRKEAGRGEQARRQWRKFLVAEKAGAGGRTVPGDVARCYGQDRAGGPVLSLSPARVDDLVGLGFQGPGANLKEVGDKEKVEVKLGKFTARRVEARGKLGERDLEYRGWLTGDAAFGWAKFEIRERADGAPSRVVFTVAAAAAGKEAKSEIDESKAR